MKMSTKRKTRKEEPLGISFALIESKLDLRKPNVHWEKRRAQGKSLRRKQPRELHAKWLPAKNRPSPLELIVIHPSMRKRSKFLLDRQIRFLIFARGHSALQFLEPVEYNVDLNWALFFGFGRFHH